jgi:hypothetical protein
MSFKRLDPEDFVVSSDSITSTLWSNNAPILNSFFTSSVQEAGSSGNFYLSVYQTSSNLSTAEIQLDIVYCDYLGSGSEFYNNIVPGYSPTRTMYGQYRSLILEDETQNFIFGSSANSGYNSCGVLVSSSTSIFGDRFWALSIERARYKESLFPGSCNLVLTGPGGIAGTTIKITDNSNDITVTPFIGATRAYQLVSGSNGSGTGPNSGYTQTSGSYGILFPDLGIIMLNPYALSESIGLTPNLTYNAPGFNNRAVYNALVAGNSFGLNSQETITSDYIFVRARNSEFNYSENPSFISGSTGEVIYSSFINNPQVYMTTIGLYNDTTDLLAVAKMSRPLIKDFTKEALVRVKLDF